MPRPPIQHHKLIIELPEAFLAAQGKETLENGIPKWRIVGAVASGVGAYLLTRVIQKTAGDIVRTTGNFFIEIARASTFVTRAITGIDPFASLKNIVLDEEVLALDPFAISMGIVFGGMVLAGQNPGEILKGIGEIVPL